MAPIETKTAVRHTISFFMVVSPCSLIISCLLFELAQLIVNIRHPAMKHNARTVKSRSPHVTSLLSIFFVLSGMLFLHPCFIVIYCDVHESAFRGNFDNMPARNRMIFRAEGIDGSRTEPAFFTGVRPLRPVFGGYGIHQIFLIFILLRKFSKSAP